MRMILRKTPLKVYSNLKKVTLTGFVILSTQNINLVTFLWF